MAKQHFIHVNQNVLRGNQKHGRDEPAITVKSGSNNQYGYGARTIGQVSIVYGGNGDPMIRCGARVVIISDEQPDVLADPQSLAFGQYRIRIDGPRIQANKRRDEMEPVVQITDPTGETVHCYGAVLNGETRVVQSIEQGQQCIAILVEGTVVPVHDKPAVVCPNKAKGACV